MSHLIFQQKLSSPGAIIYLRPHLLFLGLDKLSPGPLPTSLKNTDPGPTNFDFFLSHCI
jgi:hypothetical protein